MDENRYSSEVALKVVLLLSTILVIMDCYEIIYAFRHLKYTSEVIDREVFESCVKYHIISQICFTTFACSTAVSAAFLSLGLLISYQFFSRKVLDLFLNFNFLLFGPYLLACCFLAFLNFNNVIFNCDAMDTTKKYLNFSTLIALIICFLISFTLTIIVSIGKGFSIITNSIRFREDGWYFLGKLFWYYIFSRSDSRELLPVQVENNLQNPNNIEQALLD